MAARSVNDYRSIRMATFLVEILSIDDD